MHVAPAGSKSTSTQLFRPPQTQRRPPPSSPATTLLPNLLERRHSNRRAAIDDVLHYLSKAVAAAVGHYCSCHSTERNATATVSAFQCRELGRTTAFSSEELPKGCCPVSLL